MIAIVEMLEFDSQSQHLLIASDRKVWALRKERGLWQETAVQGSILPSSDGQPPGAGVVLAVQAEHCAALFWQGWDDLDAHHARFLLKWWRFEAGQGWQSVMERQCPLLVVHSAPMTPVMAFSPDGRQLALLERREERQQLCILSAMADPVILPQPFDVTPAAFCRLGCLAFNATGLYCAAAIQRCARIWRCDESRRWSCVAQIDNPDPEPIRFVFSPCGMQSVVSLPGSLSVWGVGADGRYREKMRLQHGPGMALQHEGSVICRSLFTPDSGQLLFSRWRRDEPGEGSWLHNVPLVPEGEAPAPEQEQEGVCSMELT